MTNLAHLIDKHPGGAPALVMGEHTTTYGELRHQVAAARGGLISLGVEPGDRVALAIGNEPAFVIAYLAGLGVGAVTVPLNPASPAPELSRQLATVRAKLSLAGRAPRPSLEHVVHVDDLIGSEPAPLVETANDDVAALMFTAGTAGTPKAAMLTHGCLRANIEQVQRTPGRAVTADDICLGVLPLFHIFGLNVVLGVSLWAGASVVLVERFDPRATLQTVADSRCTVVAGAPPIWTAWSSLTQVDPQSLVTVRMTTSGAAKLAEGVAGSIRRRYGVVLSEGYGLTEAAPVVATSTGEDAPLGSVGRPIPGVEVRLVEDDEDVLLGDPGEVWVRGPNVFPGYWEDEVATAAVFAPGGWLRTGDVAVSDDEGNMFIVDRAKDLVIVSGFNVSPAEVEEALLEHPGIAAVAVVGVDHLVTGEAVKAFVVVSGEGAQLGPGDVIDFAAARLARYKCPVEVVFVDEVPTGLGGKLVRRSLR